MADQKKFTSPKFRAAFAKVFKAKAAEEGGTPKFSVSMIFDDDAVETKEFHILKKEVNASLKEKFG